VAGLSDRTQVLARHSTVDQHFPATREDASQAAARARGEAPDALVEQAVSQAVQAMLARDVEGLERALELIVAAGRDVGSVERIRALSLLLRGDAAGAQRLVERARRRESERGTVSARTDVAMALIMLESGRATAAVREVLSGLQKARARGEPAGERACLATLALCFRHLGREDEARELERPRPLALAPSVQ
jgi:hypothetical protein